MRGDVMVGGQQWPAMKNVDINARSARLLLLYMAVGWHRHGVASDGDR